MCFYGCQKEKEAKRKALLERFGGSEFLGGNKDVAEPPTSKAQDSKSADTTCVTHIGSLMLYVGATRYA